MIYTPPARGTGGSGMAGLMKGLMAGDTARHNQERMDIMQTNQDRTTEQYESGESMQKLYGIKLAKDAGENIAPMMQNYNKWAEGTENFKGTGPLATYNWEDANDGDGGYIPEVISKYESETGKTFDPDVTPKGQSLKTNQGTFMDFDTLKAGSPKFKAYVKQKELEELLTKAKIYKAQGSGTKPTDQAEYSRLKNIKDRTPAEQSEFEAFSNKVGRTKNDAQDSIAGLLTDDNMKQAFTDLKNGGASDDKIYSKLLKLQQASGNTMPDKGKDINTRLTSFGDMNQVIADVSDLMDKGTNMGITKSMASEVAKLGDNKDLSNSEYARQMRTIMAKSKIGGMMSRYLKAVSGSAVTEDEYGRMLKNLVGGDIANVNADTMLAAMNASKDSASKTLGSEVNDISPTTPADKYRFVDKYNRARNKTASNPTLDNKGTGTKTIEQAGIDAVKEEFKAGGDYGKQAVKSIVNTLFNKDDDNVKPGHEIFNDPKMYNKDGKFEPPSIDSNGNIYDKFTNIHKQILKTGEEGKVFITDLLAKLKSGKITKDEFNTQSNEFLQNQPSSLGR